MQAVIVAYGQGVHRVFVSFMLKDWRELIKTDSAGLFQRIVDKATFFLNYSYSSNKQFKQFKVSKYDRSDNE